MGYFRDWVQKNKDKEFEKIDTYNAAGVGVNVNPPKKTPNPVANRHHAAFDAQFEADLPLTSVPKPPVAIGRHHAAYEKTLEDDYTAMKGMYDRANRIMNMDIRQGEKELEGKKGNVQGLEDIKLDLEWGNYGSSANKHLAQVQEELAAAKKETAQFEKDLSAAKAIPAQEKAQAERERLSQIDPKQAGKDLERMKRELAELQDQRRRLQNSPTPSVMNHEREVANQIAQLEQNIAQLERDLPEAARLALDERYAQGQDALLSNPRAGALYAHAETMQDDAKMARAAHAFFVNGAGSQAKVLDEYLPYLSEKYGLDQAAFERGEGQVLYETLMQTAKNDADELKGMGIRYDQMQQYEQDRQEEEEYIKQMEWARQQALSHPGISSLQSVGENIGAAGDFMYSEISGIGHNDPTDLDTYRPAQASDFETTGYVKTVRDTVANEKLGGGVGAFLYQTGMSMADSLAAMGVTALTGGTALAGSILMGASAASQTALDIVERGGTREQAFWGGLAAGAAETLAEKLPIDMLFSAKDARTLKEAMRNVLKQMGAEATEEMLTEVSNAMFDAVIMQDKSTYNLQVQQLMEQGMTKEEAEKKAFGSFVGQVARAGAGGALSGGVMGGIANVGAYAINNSGEKNSPAGFAQIGAAVLQQENGLQTAIVQGLAQGEGTEAYQHAVELVKKLENGQVITAEEVGMQIMENSIYEEAPAGGAESVDYLLDGIVENAQKNTASEESESTIANTDSTKHTQSVNQNDLPTPAMQAFEDVMDQAEQRKKRVSVTVKNERQNGSLPDGTGAMKNHFHNEVVKSKGKTLPFRDVADNVPGPYRAERTHTRIHEDESLYRAKMRLEQDYDGEKAELERLPAWDHEEVDMAMQIRANLLAEAERTGDWAEYNRWQKIVKDRNSNAGRNLQAWAKHSRHDGAAIIAAASEILEDAGKKTDTDMVMTEVSVLADKFDKAVKSQNVAQSVQEFVDVIKLTARARKTGFYQNKIMNAVPDRIKPLEWAIKRVSDLAKNADISVLNKNMLPSNERFALGERVKATDRNNYGNIVANNGDGTYEVHFENKITGKNSTVKMPADQLRTVGKKPSANRNAKNSVATLSSQEFAQQKANEAYEFLKEFAENGVLNIAQDAVPASVGEQVMTARLWSLLSKLSSWARNIGGNTLSDLLGVISTNQAVAVDRLLSKKTGTRSVAVNHLSKEGVSGSLDGVAMGMLSVSLDVSADSGGKYGSGLRTNKMSGNVFSKFLSVLEGIQGYGLVVPDYAAKSGIEAEYNRGVGKLYDKSLVKDDSLIDAGKREAEYRTYTNETMLTDAISAIRRTADKANLGHVKHLFPKSAHEKVEKLGLEKIGLGSISVPFAQVPTNAATMTVDYATGLRGLAQIGALLSDSKNGDMIAADQANVAKNIGKGMTALELAAAATVLAMKGVIRFVGNPAEEDENADEKAFRKGRGENGVQWNLSAFNRMLNGEDSEKWQNGDKLASISWAENLNAYLGFGVLMAEDMKNDELTVGGTLGNFANATLSTMGDMPLMDTISDAVEAGRYTQGGPFDKAMAAAQNFGVNVAGSFVPNAAKGIAQGLDPYQRDLYSAETTMGQIADQYRSLLDRNSLPIKYDPFGRPMMNESGWGGFANANFRPGYITTYYTDPMQDELERLAENYSTSSVYPSSKAPSKIEGENGPVDLTFNQKQKYVSVYGQTEDKVRTAITEAEWYENLPVGGDLKVHEFAETFSKQTASLALNVGYKASKWVEDLQNASAQEIADAIMLKTVESIAQNIGESVGGGKYDGLAEMTANGSVSDDVAFMDMSTTMQDAYSGKAEKTGISVTEFLDAYSDSVRGANTSEEKLANAERIAQKMYPSDTDKRVAMVSALADTFAYSFRVDVDATYEWLAKQGAAGNREAFGMLSDKQKAAYNAMPWNSGVGAAEYGVFVTETGKFHDDDYSTKKEKVEQWLNSRYGSDTAKKAALWDALYKKGNPWN